MKPFLYTILLLAACILRADQTDIVLVGQTAPTFSGETTDHATLSSESLKGRVVLVSFFTTSSGVGQTVMPQVERDIWIPFKERGLAVIAIGREHTVAELVQYRKDQGFTFTIMADPKREIYSRYAKEAVPRFYLIGKDGLVKYLCYGYNFWNFEHLKEAIAQELKPKSSERAF